jgi:hypothetical protein
VHKIHSVISNEPSIKKFDELLVNSHPRNS